MDLADRLANPPATHKAGKSVLDVWAEGLTETERAAVYKAALNLDWGHVALRDALHESGAPFIAETSLRQWRVKHGWRRES